MPDHTLSAALPPQDILIGLLTGSLFFGLGHSPSDARTYFGACFMVALFMMFGAFPQVAIVQEQKTAWYKHRDNRMYPAYAQVSLWAGPRVLRRHGGKLGLGRNEAAALLYTCAADRDTPELRWEGCCAVAWLIARR